MTKEITKAFILQEIRDKFKMREFEPDKFLFSEMVIPTYNIGPHLLVPAIKHKTLSITGTGTSIFFSIPPTEKWHLHGYNVIFMTGAQTIAGVMILRPLSADWFYLDLTAAINTSYVHILPKDVVLFPNEDIAVNVDGYTSTGNMELRLDVTVEEIR